MQMISPSQLTVEQALDCRSRLHQMTLLQLKILAEMGITAREIREMFPDPNGAPDWDFVECYDDVVGEIAQEIRSIISIDGA